MLNKRVVVAIATLGSLAIPSVSAISPVAQAQEEIAPVVADDASKQVIVDQPRVGDAKITGKVLVTDGQNTQSVTVFFPQRQHSEQVQVTREGTVGTDLVAFEYTVPTLRPLQEGETVVVGIAGNPQTFQTVTVQKALTPEVQPAPAPEPAPKPVPQPETPKPEGDKKPEGEKPAPAPSPAPEGEQKPAPKPGVENPETPKPGEKEQQPEVTPEKPGQPETTPQEPQQPEAPRPAPEEEKKPEVKKPETPKPEGEKPAPAPKPMPKPEGEQKPAPKPSPAPEGEQKPEIDKDMLQGSSTVGDLFKILAALGGVAGLISGVVKLLTLGSGSANFLQPLRGFLSQFNIRF